MPFISGGASAVVPTEISYTEFTANVNVISTTEGTPTTVVTAPAHTYDGSTKVRVEFYAPGVLEPTISSSAVVCNLWDGTDQGRILITQASTGTAQDAYGCYAVREFTPSAGAHTFSVRAWCGSTSGTPAILAGAGGAGTAMPGFIRVTTVV